jgi:AhpD family alkylhydroperoxidase
MTTTIPARRIQLSQVAPRQYSAMFALSASLGLDHRLRLLLDVRASQINGCAFCLDMHYKDARAGGISEERLSMLDAWRESALYDPRERAALELCEAITLIAEGRVPDAVWDAAAAVFDQTELGQLVFAITTINAWNRLMVASRAEPGHYQPGQFQRRSAQ